MDVSNVWSAPSADLDWEGLVAAVGRWFPGRPLVGYQRGEALLAAVEAVRVRRRGYWSPDGHQGR